MRDGCKLSFPRPPRSRVLARLTSLTQTGELARRLLIRWGISDETHVKRAASFQIVSGHCSSVELFSYFLAVMGSSSSKKNTGKVVTLSLISLYRFGSSNGL